MVKIEHFSHRHRLTLDQKKYGKWYQRSCYGCRKKISGDLYGCTKCKYYICKSCAGLAREMRHPFHREHPLSLLAQLPYETITYQADFSSDDEESAKYESGVPANPSAYCDVCSMTCDGFIFHCPECKFNLDVNCATLIPTTTTTTTNNNNNITHQHPLIPCERTNKQVDFDCSVCRQRIIKGAIYACLHCRVILDESCIQLPQQITHHFHSHHSLTLTAFKVYFSDRCKACGVSQNRFWYACSECNFYLDTRCASLMPKAIIKSYDDRSLEENHHLHLQEEKEEPFTHLHGLIPCDNTKPNFTFSCSACQTSIEDGTVYVCLKCRYLLHKSCAKLPLEIKHPFHPPHPLSLISDDTIGSYYQCRACKCSVSGFNYRCAQCHFQMDVTCASLTYSTLKFELHKHPLAYFHQNNPRLLTFTQEEEANSVSCSNCKMFTGFPFFRCVPCNFSVKLCCLWMLPHTFKHTNHRHSLTLTYSLIKDNLDDDDDSEYYCDVCEETRNLWEPTYYCEDCHYVAHTSCVFHEILPLLGREWPLPPDEEIIMLQAKVDALITKIATLTTKLDELKERCAQHITEYQIGVTEAKRTNAFDHPTIGILMLQAEESLLIKKLETLITKLDELKERHPQHIDGYQIGSIPSLGIKSPVTILDDFDEVAEEDCSVESMKTDEDEDVGTMSPVKILNNSVEVVDTDEYVESDGTFSTIAKLDEEIKAITVILETQSTKLIETLSAKLEALKTKHAHACVSHLEHK